MINRPLYKTTVGYEEPAAKIRREAFELFQKVFALAVEMTLFKANGGASTWIKPTTLAQGEK